MCSFFLWIFQNVKFILSQTLSVDLFWSEFFRTNWCNQLLLLCKLTGERKTKPEMSPRNLKVIRVFEGNWANTDQYWRPQNKRFKWKEIGRLWVLLDALLSSYTCVEQGLNCEEVLGGIHMYIIYSIPQTYSTNIPHPRSSCNIYPIIWKSMNRALTEIYTSCWKISGTIYGG